ncbi:hypothetical protein MF672_032970 [Actinomadura sp. ATCC 31491]|uniref:Uncharacterized protein n=1 Tax=Actinomadura luzonensis TaxID=2805427 RepID=A0ABT0G1V5_9ACTN|nr:hypothetical protein [Actinomadura luzonensis]MCK2218573.1 hypothetical protein [Actinomadura luzonensis]
MLIATLRDARLRALRWGSGALVAAYAIPVAFWQLGPSDAPSLTKYMNPAVTAILIAAGVAVALAFHVQRRRAAAQPTAD